MPPKGQNERPVSELPSPMRVFRFFHLPLGQSLIFLPCFPLLPAKFFTNIQEQKRLPSILCTKATNSGLYHASEGGEMQMTVSCHSREHSSMTPQGHTAPARLDLLFSCPSPPSYSVLLHGLPWAWGDLPLPHAAKGLLLTGKSPDTDMTKTLTCC